MNPIVAAALAVIKALAGNSTVKKIILDLLKDLASKTETKVDDIIVEIVAESWGCSAGEARFRISA